MNTVRLVVAYALAGVVAATAGLAAAGKPWMWLLPAVALLVITCRSLNRIGVTR